MLYEDGDIYYYKVPYYLSRKTSKCYLLICSMQGICMLNCLSFIVSQLFMSHNWQDCKCISRSDDCEIKDQRSAHPHEHAS